MFFYIKMWSTITINAVEIIIKVMVMAVAKEKVKKVNLK